MDSSKILAFNYDRRFGAEMEMNSLDKRDFRTHPLDGHINELPQGIEEIASHIHLITGNSVLIKTWHPTHNNMDWVIKPDRSCGMELCSPVAKGWLGLKNICEVSEALGMFKFLSIDHR